VPPEELRAWRGTEFLSPVLSARIRQDLAARPFENTKRNPLGRSPDNTRATKLAPAVPSYEATWRIQSDARAGHLSTASLQGTGARLLTQRALIGS
jgi:hypothetical protein